MKFILMILVLFILTDPVLAQPVSNSPECQNMHRGLMNAYDTGKPVSKKQIIYFFDTCMPENTASDDETYSRKLIQKAEDIKVINTASM